MKTGLVNEDVVIHQTQPKSLHRSSNFLATSVCVHRGTVRAAHSDRLPISWWSNRRICHHVRQQINDNYPADMSTVRTLQDQEQGGKEMKKEGVKGSGPHLALSWSTLREIWLWPAPRLDLRAAQQAITAFIHRAVQSQRLCVLMCVCQKQIHTVWQLTHQ